MESRLFITVITVNLWIFKKIFISAVNTAPVRIHKSQYGKRRILFIVNTYVFLWTFFSPVNCSILLCLTFLKGKNERKHQLGKYFLGIFQDKDFCCLPLFCRKKETWRFLWFYKVRYVAPYKVSQPYTILLFFLSRFFVVIIFIWMEYIVRFHTLLGCLMLLNGGS